MFFCTCTVHLGPCVEVGGGGSDQSRPEIFVRRLDSFEKLLHLRLQLLDESLLVLTLHDVLLSGDNGAHELTTDVVEKFLGDFLSDDRGIL